MDYKTMTIDDIINWCVANNQVAWLKEISATKPSYFVLKRYFCKKFMPEIIPQAKPKKVSFYDRIASL